MLPRAVDVIIVWWYLRALLVDARKLTGRPVTKRVVHGKLNVLQRAYGQAR